MIFIHLPKRVKDDIVKLTKDKVFQERFGTDKLLDEYYEEKGILEIKKKLLERRQKRLSEEYGKLFKKIDERATELVCDRLVEYGTFTEEEKQYYFELMQTEEEKRDEVKED